MLLKESIEDYRDGAVGSLLDEYEKALAEIKTLLGSVTEVQYSTIADHETDNEDCRSIETLVTHVICAGYIYSNYIRGGIGMPAVDVVNSKIPLPEIHAELDKMFQCTEEVFEFDNGSLATKLDTVYISASWGFDYNVDQLMEHAIVHILRHRRQIEKFLLVLKGD